MAGRAPEAQLTDRMKRSSPRPDSPGEADLEENLIEALRQWLLASSGKDFRLEVLSPFGEARVSGVLDLRAMARAASVLLDKRVSEEREQCAEIARHMLGDDDKLQDPYQRGIATGRQATASLIADLIRARAK